jgi:hypothetical protein
MIALLSGIGAVQAQGIEQLLGKSYNDQQVQEFLSGLNGEALESFIPFRRVYKLSYKEDGVELEFNSDMSLFQVNLYDSGYTFGAYRGELPHGAFWTIDSVQLQAESGIMHPDPKNEFVKYYQEANYTTQCYFRNARLEHIKLIASMQLMENEAPTVLNNWGMRLLPDGQVVSGNVLDGEGVMKWGDAGQYDGEWMYGLPHGLGIYSDSFGNVYAGEFKLGFFWGSGSYESASYNYRFDGQYIMGRRHGQGLIDYGQGRTYSGQWVLDQMHGIGQYTMTKQYYYQGMMKNNMFNGQGVLTTPDGYIKGQFKNGKPHGYCEQFANQSQQTLSGYWRDGMKQGEFNLNAFGFDQKVEFKDDKEVTRDGAPKKLPEN